MLYDIKLNSNSNIPIFSAEIDCPRDTPESEKKRLVLLWAKKTKTNITGCDFSGVNLEDIVLDHMDLSGCDFSGANFKRASMARCNFGGVDLTQADLTCANFRRCDFLGSQLNKANLSGVSLYNSTGNRQEIKSLQLDTYNIVYTADQLQIGCEHHPMKMWWEVFNADDIEAMDGEQAVVWWGKWKPILKQLIEASPAKPHGGLNGI